VKAKFDNYTYARVVDSLRGPMVEALSGQAVHFFADVLNQALDIESESGDEDHSYIWRPAIEDHEQNELQENEIPSRLVTVLREAAREAVKVDPANAEEVFEDLLNRKRSIFLRIAYFVAKDQRYAGAALRRMLVDKFALESTALQRDYALLLASGYGLLEPDDRSQILDWIRNRPAMQDDDPERGEIRAARWKGSRLHIIREHLSDEAREDYEQLVKKHGEPSPVDFPYQVGGGWVGPTAPVSQEHLSSRADEEILQFLQDWTPEKGSWGPDPSRQGLARELETFITENPQRMWPLGDRLRKLNPTYVAALFTGLTAALGKNKEFDWNPPLQLSRWVAAQPYMTEPSGDWDDGEKTWNSSKLAAARLAAAGFRSDANPVPSELRELAWHAFAPVTDDPDPTPAYEAQYGGTNMGPTMLAINSSRGEAMEAVVAYGLWVRKNLTQADLDRGFASMPEVQAVLDRHLDPGVDPSIGIRSVYGQWFPWLHLMDPAWATENKRRIFPETTVSSVLWEVAFKTYLVHVKPFDAMLTLLRGEYEKAVDRIGKADYATRYAADPEERLGEHLVIFLARGKLTLDDPLLKRFYERATASLRRHVINFLGRSLWGDTAPSADVHNRMRALWHTRLAHFEKGNPADQELKAFGAWFATKQEDPEWALEQLTAVLRVQPDIDLEFMVIKRLAALAPRFPSQAAEALHLLVSGAPELWKLTIEHETVRTILKAALAGDKEARINGLRTIELFGKAGFHGFRDMLPT
jgi:hypothetical protein